MPGKTVLAIVGSYRKGGVIDTATDEILDAARNAGADTIKIYLIDQHLSYCTNCRTCTQKEGNARGECILADDMTTILDAAAAADAIILGSPMNFGTVTAVTKTFMERLLCYAYWPWRMNAPRVRNPHKSKVAVVVASSAAPALVARLSSRMVRLLKDAAGLMSARTVGVLFIGLAAKTNGPHLSERVLKKAHRLGRRLAEGE